MLHRAVIKPVLFLATWYECAVELGLGGAAAFAVALLVWTGFGFVIRLLGQAIAMIGPRGVRLILVGAIWLACFWWLAPGWVLNAPLFVIAAVLGAIGLAGAKARELAEARRREEPSPGAIGLLIATLVAAALALRPVLPLAELLGYLVLPGIPFGIGWHLVPPGAPRRQDARFGEAGAFRDAGLSEDR